MSFQAMTWAAKQRTGSAQRKALLLSIANYASPEDGTCWPSRKRLSHDAEMSLASVDRHIKDLEELGFLSQRQVSRTSDGGWRTEIKLNLDVDTSEKFEPGTQWEKRNVDKRITELRSRQIEGTSETGEVPSDQGPGPVNLREEVPSNCGSSKQLPEPAREPAKKQTPPNPPAGRARTIFRSPSHPSALAEACRALAAAHGSDAAEVHDSLAVELERAGFAVEREVPVADRGDGRAGRVDLVAAAAGGVVAIEADANCVREKSLRKLAWLAEHRKALRVAVLRQSELAICPAGLDAVVILEPGPDVPGEFVRADSAEGSAWEAHWQAHGERPKWIETRNGLGRYLPTKFPPPPAPPQDGLARNGPGP